MPAIISRVGTREIWASRAGVPSVNPADGVTGNDASASLNAIFASGPVRLIVDQLCKCHDVSVSSGSILEGYGGSWYGSGNRPNTGLCFSPNGNPSTATSCIRNTNWRSPCSAVDSNGASTASVGTTSVPDFSRILDHDITIRNLFVDGNRGTGTSQASQGNSDPRGNNAVFWQNTFALWGIRNLTLENIWVYNPPTYAFFPSYIDHCSASNLTHISPDAVTGPTSNNTDGFHVVGPARGITLNGIYGYSGDDFVALNADDGNIIPGLPINSVGPGLWGDNRNVFCGPILDCDLRAINLVQGTSCLRLLSKTNLVDGISVTGVRGYGWHYFIGMDTVLSIGPGNIGRVNLSDLQGESENRGSFNGAINLSQNTASRVSIRGLRMLGTGAMSLFPAVHVGGGTYGTIEIHDAYVNNYQNLLSIDSGGTVTNVIVSNSEHPTKQSGQSSIATASTVAVLAGTGNIGLTKSGTYTSNLGFVTS